MIPLLEITSLMKAGSGIDRTQSILTTKDLLNLPPVGHCLHRDVRFVTKEGQIGSNWDKSGTFSDQISVHFGAAAPKCTEI